MITSGHGKEMLANSPRLYESSRVFQAHIEAKGIELDDVDSILKDIEGQFSASTATWGLRYWEEICGIPTNEQESLEVRRARVLAILQSSPSVRRIDMERIIDALGFKGSTIVELWRSMPDTMLHNGNIAYDGIGYRVGYMWAMFKLRVGLAEWRNFLSKDKEEIKSIIEEIKPAHLALAGMSVSLGFTDRIEQFVEQDLLSVTLQSVDPFLRAGFRHSGQTKYQKVFAYDNGFLHNGAQLHNSLLSFGAIMHRCVDETSSVQAQVRLEDNPRIHALHDGGQRLGLSYTRAMALDQAHAVASIGLADEVPDAEEVIEPISRVSLAEYFAGESLAHGVPPWPQRTGVILYRSHYPHRPRVPRGGANIYGDHLLRFLGPRRDGRHKYGRTLQETPEAFKAKVLLQDKPVTQIPARNSRFFYRDKGLYHGNCPAPVEAPEYSLSWQGVDNVDFPADQVANKANVAASDAYPGRDPVHGAPEQSLHDGNIYHKFAGNYAWQGGRYDGLRCHGEAPFDRQGSATAKLFLGDVATGQHLYGGNRLCHNGGGLRWKHHGFLLRRPFTRHDALWFRDGTRRYLEGLARYGDLSVMHDGINQYGVSGGLHEGSLTRQPVVLPEDLHLVARRGYRRIAV